MPELWKGLVTDMTDQQWNDIGLEAADVYRRIGALHASILDADGIKEAEYLDLVDDLSHALMYAPRVYGKVHAVKMRIEGTA